ncbi:hypothetical protein MTR_6g004490 [Medicago truncatula]|uniref:Uncharacterized protein n=1 Tax=Medicago truncatula TaxID=3880 RepID=A0A072U4U3_MEDTR|nr:hypothetical protein MTR_6g004490 [Medicago truncatula]
MKEETKKRRCKVSMIKVDIGNSGRNNIFSLRARIPIEIILKIGTISDSLIEIKWKKKNGKDYNECNYEPWVEDEESSHFLDDEEEEKEKTCLGSYWVCWNCN